MEQQSGVVAVAEGLTADAFHQILEFAISGKGKLPGAKAAAKSALGKYQDPERAVKRVVLDHIAFAGGQGFATNWGGFFVGLVTMPANVAAITFVQARMISAVAHLRGYDLADPRVRTAILMVMLGPGSSRTLVSSGELPSTPFAVATAPVFDAQLDGRASRALLDRAMGHLGGKRLGVFLGKGIPFVGGGVGAVVDGWSTRTIGRLAVEQLPSRRPKK